MTERTRCFGCGLLEGNHAKVAMFSTDDGRTICALCLRELQRGATFEDDEYLFERSIKPAAVRP